MHIKIYILKRKKMYLTGVFNIPVASTAIVKVIFADISIITFYFQYLQYNLKTFCRPKSMYFTRSQSANDFFVRVQQTETFRTKTKGKYECFFSQDH